MFSLTKSDACLRLSKSPGIRTSALFVGIVSLGFGAAYYGSDNLLLKSGYIIVCVIIGLSLLEEWESCIIDKDSRTITLSRANVYQRFLRLRGSRDLEFAIDKVMSVRVEVPKSSSGGSTASSRRVLLLLTSGISLPVLDGDDAALTQVECDLLADHLRTFLNLNHLQAVNSVDLYDWCHCYSDRDGGSSSEDVEFEPLANDGRPRETVNLIPQTR